MTYHLIKTNFTFFLIILPLFSSFVGLSISAFNFRLGFMVEKLIRDPLQYSALFLILFSSICKMRLHKKILFALLYIVLLFIPLLNSVVHNIPISSAIKIFRDLLVLVIPIIIGYKVLDEKAFRQTLIALSILSLFIILIEIAITPYKLWTSIGFTDYYLKRDALSCGLNWNGAFNGYKNEQTILGIYQNFDSFNGELKINTRYGGIVGEPIEFGHIFAFLTIFLISISKSDKNKRNFKFLSYILLAVGFIFIKTKGYMVGVLIYLLTKLFIRHKLLRLPIIIFGVLAATLIVVISLKYQLSSLGHLMTLLIALQTFKDNVLLGSGLGSTNVMFEDSFIAKILVEGGLFSFLLYVSIVFFLINLFRKNHKTFSTNTAILLATFVPPLLSGAAIHLISIYLNLFYLGLLLRKNETTVERQYFHA